MNVYHMCSCSLRPGESISSPVTGLTEDCKPPWVFGIEPKFSGSAASTQLLSDFSSHNVSYFKFFDQPFLLKQLSTGIKLYEVIQPPSMAFP